jgi:hypothetical protein
MASTATHGHPMPIPGQRACSPHHGRLQVRQQCGGGKQRCNGICSGVLAVAARWQHWQSGRGSAAAAWRWQAAQQRHRQRMSGNSSALATVAVAVAAQRRWAAGQKVAAERWQRRQHAASAKQRRQRGSGKATAHSMVEASAARGQWWQCSGGGDSNGGSTAEASRGIAG